MSDLAMPLPDAGVQAQYQKEHASPVVPAEVIVVTAQSRTTEKQLAPVAIATVGRGALDTNRVVSISEIGRLVPELQVRSGTIATSVQINIRGLGAAASTAIEPSVATFVDGAYLPRGGSVVGTFLDVDQIDVLRGPQGTLFGRNASVGALSIHTGQPEQMLGGRVLTELGSGDRRRLEAVANVPTTHASALRIAGVRQWFGGLWHNRLDGRQLGGKDETAGRISFSVRAGDFQLLLRADASHAQGDAFANLDFDPKSVSAAQLASLSVLLGGSLPDTNLSDNIANQYVTAVLHDQQWGASADLSWFLGASKLNLLSAYRDWSNHQLDGDLAWTPVPLLSRFSSFQSKSESHEVQFVSPRRAWLGGLLDLVAGAYLFDEQYSTIEQFNLGAGFCALAVAAANPRAACNGYLAMTGGLSASDLQFSQRTTSYAAYAQSNWYLTSGLSLTVGGRWTLDHKRGNFDQTISTPFVSALRAPESLALPKISDNKMSWKFRLNYAPLPRTLLFATYSTGFKSAGYNSGGSGVPLSIFDANGTLVSTRRTFRSENSTNYELGAKFSDPAGSLSAELLAYRMDVSDYQDRALSGTTVVLRNSGDVRQQGMELRAAVRPATRVALTAAVSYLNSKFISFPNASGLPGVGGTQDLTGERARFSPEWSGSIGFEIGSDFGGAGWNWTAAGNLSFVSSQFIGSTTDANPQTLEPGYALVDGKIAISDASRRWTISVYGKNLTNTQYSVGNFNQVLDGVLGLRNGIFPGSTAIRKIHADPRTVGVAIQYAFGHGF